MFLISEKLPLFSLSFNSFSWSFHSQTICYPFHILQFLSDYYNHENKLKDDFFPSWFYTILKNNLVLSSVSSVSQSCPTLCDPMNRSTPGLPVHHQLPEFTQTHVHRVHDAIQPSHPLSPLLLLPPIPPSIRVFSNESTLHMRWPKYWNFSLSISPPKEIPGLSPFRILSYFYNKCHLMQMVTELFWYQLTQLKCF